VAGFGSVKVNEVSRGLDEKVKWILDEALIEDCGSRMPRMNPAANQALARG
jgi:hypothetical protein